MYIYDICLTLCRMRNFSDRNRKKTRSVNFSETRTVHEVMWKNVVQPGMTQLTAKRCLVKMRFASLIPKQEYTHARTRTHTHANTHTRTHIHKHKYTNTHTNKYTNTHTNTLTYTQKQIHKHTHKHTHIHTNT
jgi:hypothetical protein